MVCDHAVGGQIGLARRVRMPRQLLYPFDQRQEEVRLVIGGCALQDRDDPLEAHPGINVLFLQGDQFFGRKPVILDENVVPDLEEAFAVAVDAADMTGDALHIAEFRTAVVVDLSVGAAGAGLGHFPEVVLASEGQQVGRVKAGLGQPDIGRFAVLRDLAQFIFKVSGPKVFFGELPDFRQQLPGPGDGFFFVVVAKGPVPQHLKEGVMRVIAADFIKVVVFAGDPQAFLRVDRAGVGALVGAEEDILELHHAGVGEEQGGITARDER